MVYQALNLIIEPYVLRKCRVYFSKRMYAKATKLLKCARFISGDAKGVYHCWLGAAKLWLGDYTGAISDLSIADEKCNSKSANVLRLRGTTYFCLDDLCKAASDFSDAISVAHNKQSPPLHVWRGLISEYCKNHSIALQDYMELAERYPRVAFWSHKAAFILCCCPDPTVRNPTLAVEYALRACECTKWKSWKEISVLASARAATGDFDQAVRMANLAKGLVPTDLKDERQERVEMYMQGDQYVADCDYAKSNIELLRSLVSQWKIIQDE